MRITSISDIFIDNEENAYRNKCIKYTKILECNGKISSFCLFTKCLENFQSANVMHKNKLEIFWTLFKTQRWKRKLISCFASRISSCEAVEWRESSSLISLNLIQFRWSKWIMWGRRVSRCSARILVTSSQSLPFPCESCGIFIFVRSSPSQTPPPSPALQPPPCYSLFEVEPFVENRKHPKTSKAVDSVTKVSAISFSFKLQILKRHIDRCYIRCKESHKKFSDELHDVSHLRKGMVWGMRVAYIWLHRKVRR